MTGAVSLAGTLAATLVNGFVPQDGNTFTIVTSPEITGAFQMRNLPTLGGGLGWVVRLNPTNIALEVAPDTDGDNYADAGDCAPTDGTVHSPAVEVAGVAFAADKQTLSWLSQAAITGVGTVYDAVRGLVASLPVGGFGESCVLAGGATPQVVEPTLPDPGIGFYYLVRARNACGVAGYGEGTGGAPRTTTACP